MNTINWDRLRFFLAAAEGGSLTAAARELGSNQPTVGRHIDALESSLGIRLFQRSVKGLMLTEEGIQLLERCRAIQSQVVKIGRTLSEKKTISGTIRLALPEGLCLEVLAPLLPKFYSEFPQVRLILNVSANTANLTRGEADIAVRLFRPTQSNLVVRALGNMGMGLYASRSYIDLFGRPATTTELSRHRVIAYGDQLATLPANQWLIKHSHPEFQVLNSDSTGTRLKATLAGVGISVQPHLFTRNNPELVPVLKEVSLPDHEVWLAYHSDLRQHARVQAVTDFVKSALIPLL
ncbi:MAG: LysR family transcriptional regulator [Pseudomonadota bacterium]